MSSETNRPLRQRTTGVLDGVSNQATNKYYHLLNQRLNARHGGWDNDEIVMVSVKFGNIEYFIRHDRWAEAKTYLAEKVNRLERAGAGVVVCVSNTMHRVVEPIMIERKVPFIHIADPTGEAIRKAGIIRVALLGTMPVMCSAELAKPNAERFGVEIMVPSDPDKAIVDRIIFNELVRRDPQVESKAEYLRIIDILHCAGAQGVILGCTEIFLLMGQADLPGFLVFDTTVLHVDAAVAFALTPSALKGSGADGA